MAQEICKRNQFGFCKYGDTCRYLHINTLCDSNSCEIFNCTKRHPYKCRFYREHGRCKFGDYCKYKHELYEKTPDNGTKREIQNLKEKIKQMEKAMIKKEDDFEKLTAVVMKLSEIIKKSNQSFNDNEQTDKEESTLEQTFLNPSSEMACDVCNFVSKNSRGLKIHKRAKHTKTNKFKCDMCDFSTNNKKFFSDHKASKCSRTILCDFDCGETFETEEEEIEHLKIIHAKGKTFQCEVCDFETTKKKFFNDHKASKCLKIFLCDLGCAESFETIEEENIHMVNVHNW